MPAESLSPHSSPGSTPGLEAAAAAVTAAQRALAQARRELSAAVHDARRGGEPVRAIAERTGLDAMTIRNILAVSPAVLPGRGS
ncbi:hypothetical protein [Streptomyces sp. NPDC058661]|uniref:hypothetical protein n=1 Tax=Streptomyces sp. NPDC058661 TaxID=3346582 RepID=UPI00365E80BC